MGMRGDLERMVDQIEAETARGEAKGRLPALYVTMTTAIYKWHQLHEMIEKFAAWGGGCKAAIERVVGETTAGAMFQGCC